MKLFIFSNDDYNFSAKIAKICDLGSDSLDFCDNYKKLNNIKIKDDVLVLVDYDDVNFDLKILIGIKKIYNFKCCLIMSKIEKSIHKKALEIGCDIVITKSNFLMNYKTIKEQLKF